MSLTNKLTTCIYLKEMRMNLFKRNVYEKHIITLESNHKMNFVSLHYIDKIQISKNNKLINKA